MTNFAQARFDLGLEAAHLLNEVMDITEHSGPDIDEEYRKRSDDVQGTDQSLRTLNRLYVRHDTAWANYHIFKNIADTVFSGFIPERGKDWGQEDYSTEVARLMSGVNGFPEVVNYPFIEDMSDPAVKV